MKSLCRLCFSSVASHSGTMILGQALSLLSLNLRNSLLLLSKVSGCSVADVRSSVWQIPRNLSDFAILSSYSQFKDQFTEKLDSAAVAEKGLLIMQL